MTISIRKKKLKDGQESLFLDYYLPKAKQKRRKESLKLKIFSNPRNTRERDHNKKTMMLAESIRSKKLLELQHKTHGFSHLVEDNSDKNFVAYIAMITEDRYNSNSNYGAWKSTLKHLKGYCGEVFYFKDIDANWLKGFQDYLLKEVKSKSGKPLSQNSCYSYYNKLKAGLNKAVKDRMIDYNPAHEIKGLKEGEVKREFLTLEELKAVSKEECEYPVLKNAFLFSALTGIRWSDINKLVWSEVQYSDENGWYIRFRQKKTLGVETLPIPQQARDLLGEQGDLNDRVFVGLKYSAWHNVKLQQWMMKAGISKTITFHCARHTFATLQLTLGTDIYTVSKLLGHRELKTTQVYAKIIDKKKVDAVNIIPDIGL